MKNTVGWRWVGDDLKLSLSYHKETFIINISWPIHSFHVIVTNFTHNIVLKLELYLKLMRVLLVIFAPKTDSHTLYFLNQTTHITRYFHEMDTMITLFHIWIFKPMGPAAKSFSLFVNILTQVSSFNSFYTTRDFIFPLVQAFVYLTIFSTCRCC